jgi:hypothetical protein
VEGGGAVGSLNVGVGGVMQEEAAEVGVAGRKLRRISKCVLSDLMFLI